MTNEKVSTVVSLLHAVIAVAVMGQWSPLAAAQEGKRTAPDEFTATTANLASGAGTKVTIQVLRWLSEADRTKAAAVLSANGDQHEKELAQLPTCGYIWTQGPIGYALKYAHRISERSGGERIVLVTDRPLGSLDFPEWKDSSGNSVRPRASTVVELRLSPNGSGSGRISFAGLTVYDEGTKAVGISASDNIQATLSDVRHRPNPSSATESETTSTASR
jgi:hypothetical protein